MSPSHPVPKVVLVPVPLLCTVHIFFLQPVFVVLQQLAYDVGADCFITSFFSFSLICGVSEL